MRQFLKKHNIWLKLLSLLLSITLWVVVMQIADPIKTFWRSDIPVIRLGEDELFSKTGLSVVEISDEVVDVQVRGENSLVSQSSLQDKITVTVDVSKVENAGTVTLPLNASVARYGVEAVGTNPETVKVRVEKEETREHVPIKLGITGQPASGYQAGTPTTVVEGITVRGPESDMQNVAYAYAVIDVSNATNMVQQDCEIVLCDEAGAAVDMTYMKLSVDTVRVSVSVFQQNRIKLAVTLKESDEITKDMVKCTITPQYVQVYGDQNEIANLTEINLGEIDLANASTDKVIEFPITLPETIHLADGEPRTASVLVSISGLGTKTVAVDGKNVLITDSGEQKESHAVRVLDEQVQVELRGAQSDLAKVDASNLTVTVVVDSMDLGVGTHEAVAVITPKNMPEGVTLLQDKITLKVNVTKKAGNT